MTWANFDGKPYTREQFAARVAGLTWTDWRPKGITLHNTAAPTLKQWAESGPAHDARIRNLQSYYEKELGWHAGPHLFISRNFINGFSNLLARGVHSRCFNATHIGIECVGDYNAEQWDSGDGAMVRDNAVFAMAVLYRKLGLDPKALTFHVECKQDNHDCPGKNVHKPDVIARVKAKMAELAGDAGGPILGTAHPAPVPLPAPAPKRKIIFRAHGKMSTFGGPDDTGMKSTEGLALWSSAAQMVQHGLGDYLVGSLRFPGLGRRLNPSKAYLACRWDYNRTPVAFLQNAVAYVMNDATGEIEKARPMDWGPNVSTGRVADLSPGLARRLKLETSNSCTVIIYEDGK